MKTKIIYEDKDLLVCHKPAGLAVESAGIGQMDMVSELKNYLKSPYLGVVHRLDQPVEGLLVFAKHKAAAADLSRQLQKDILNKEYSAVVCGQPSEKEAKLVDYLVKDNKSRTARVAAKEQEAAKEAILTYRVSETCEIEQACGETKGPLHQVSLLTVQIQTGRFHQIRAQLSHMGNPILGDQKYASPLSAEVSKAVGARNVALCAGKISFLHPSSKEKITFAIEPKEGAFALFKK